MKEKKHPKGSKNALEGDLAALNANIFWREFSFAKNVFHPKPDESAELADQIVWIDDLVIAFQLKERGVVPGASAESEKKWFERKVLGDATSQVRDTVRFLSEHEEIGIENQRGHVFKLSGRKLKRIIKLVVYAPGDNLPESCRRIRHHVSTSSAAGLMHIMPVQDYMEICQTLVTPAEIAEYFEFRERTINKWPKTVAQVSEQALMGQFLSSNDDAIPNEQYVEYLTSFENDVDNFGLTVLLRDFAEHTERVVAQGADNDYYRILIEFAKLTRGDLREVKLRIKICMDACHAGDTFPITRIAVPGTGCGFVFIPIPKGVPNPLAALELFTRAAKYDLRVQRQIGVSIAKEGKEYLINWCLMEFPWQHDPEMEEKLRRSNPFLSVKEKILTRYQFSKGAA